MATPHDSFSKAIFSRPEEAAKLLPTVLPSEVATQLDLSTVRHLPGSFVDEHLRWRHTDVLYEVAVAGSPALVFVLAEMQSTVDSLMPLRMLIYLGRIWDRWLSDHEKTTPTRYPAILPVVVYQGPEPWTATTEFLGAVDLPQELLGKVRDFLPSFRCMLDDLSAQTDGAIQARGLSPLGTLGLLLLKHARDEAGRLLQLLATFVEEFNALDSDDDRELVLSYLLQVVDSEPGEVIDALGSRALSEIREAVMTAAEKLEKRGSCTPCGRRWCVCCDAGSSGRICRLRSRLVSPRPVRTT